MLAPPDRTAEEALGRRSRRGVARVVWQARLARDLTDELARCRDERSEHRDQSPALQRASDVERRSLARRLRQARRQQAERSHLVRRVHTPPSLSDARCAGSGQLDVHRRMLDRSERMDGATQGRPSRCPQGAPDNVAMGDRKVKSVRRPRRINGRSRCDPERQSYWRWPDCGAPLP